jgi:nicotinamidase-related amidase
MSRPEDAALDVLHKDRALLVVVDLQEKLLPPISERERVLGSSLLLIRAARELELPIVLTT